MIQSKGNFYLKAKNLTYHRGREPLLKPVELAIENQGIYLVVGANGAGKSLLLQLLSGRLLPSRGELSLESRDIHWSINEEPKTRFYVRMMMDSLVGDLSLSVERYLAKAYAIYLASMPKLSGFTLENVLEMTALKKLRNIKIMQLSLGQRRLLSLAVILLMEPKFLFLDEPLSALDGRHAKQIRGLIQELSSSIGFVMSSHDFSEDLSLAKELFWVRERELLHYLPDNLPKKRLYKEIYGDA